MSKKSPVGADVVIGPYECVNSVFGKTKAPEKKGAVLCIMLYPGGTLTMIKRNDLRVRDTFIVLHQGLYYL